MLKTVRQACRFNPIIKNYRMSEGIENLSDLINDNGDGRDFFARNFVTKGMEQLFREGMLRFKGLSDQAVFELTQAMGGGKTHLMVALGLLARHPHLRQEVLPADLAQKVADLGPVRVAAFNGRNNPDHYIWGEIANQLGASEKIKPYWANGPKPVDEAKWKEIIGNEPTLIMLDELPPYLEQASTVKLGDGTLATTTVYTLGCLMSAALELDNCLIVIANLSGSYGSQAKAIAQAVSNLQQEAGRQAKRITPVELAGNEIYEILKKRLIDELPGEDVIDEVAEEYAQRIKAAADGGYIVATSLEQVAQQVRETYPFHPSFKYLVALFQENEGFRQTRGLMQFAARLLKSVDERKIDDVFLVGTQHLNLNDDTVREEVRRIAHNLVPAATHDIADHGNAIAEEIDAEMGDDAARQVATLLLASSLSRSVGGRIGLTEGEIIEFLSAPNRKPDEFLVALGKLKELAWYLHREDERYFVKETENLSRQIERNARVIPQPKIDEALIRHMTGILTPRKKQAYQEVTVLPRLDELKLGGPRVLIVIRPDGKVPPGKLNDFFQHQTEKNNFMVLSGQDSHLADAVEDRLRDLYAIEQIHKRIKPGDTLFEEARDRQEDAQERFYKTVSGAYNKLYFPGVDDMDRPELQSVTLDNGLTVGSAEEQIEQSLASVRCNKKLIIDIKPEMEQHWAMAEVDLWPERERRTPWKDVVMRAKNNAAWIWLPGTSGLENLKNEALKQGRWRQGSDGYIEKGPFPKEKTTVNITIQSYNAESGETLLQILPRNAGSSPVVHYSKSADVSTSSPKVEDLDNFATKDATLYFLAVDVDGRHETGEAKRWTADLKIRHAIKAVADKRAVTLECTPAADMLFTLDGTNPKENGQPYTGPIEIDMKAARLLVYASADEANTRADFPIPAGGNAVTAINDIKPARLVETKKVNLDSTEKVYQVINTFKKGGTTFKGVTVQIGEGADTVSVRFQEREITAVTIEKAIEGIRSALGNAEEAVTVTIKSGARFDSGMAIKDFAKVSGIELKPGDVIQDEV